MMFTMGINAVGGLLGFLIGLFAFRILVTYISTHSSACRCWISWPRTGVVLGLAVALQLGALGNVDPGIPLRILTSVIGVILDRLHDERQAPGDVHLPQPGNRHAR